MGKLTVLVSCNISRISVWLLLLDLAHYSAHDAFAFSCVTHTVPGSSGSTRLRTAPSTKNKRPWGAAPNPATAAWTSGGGEENLSPPRGRALGHSEGVKGRPPLRGLPSRPLTPFPFLTATNKLCYFNNLPFKLRMQHKLASNESCSAGRVA